MKNELKKSIILSLVLLISCKLFAQATTAKIVVPYFKNNLYGFCDTLGVVKILPAYDEVAEMEYYFDTTTINFTTALFSVYKNGRCSVINQSGKLVIPNTVQFDSANFIHYFPEIIQLQKGDKTGLFYKNKLILNCEYDIINIYPNNRFLVKRNGLCGLVNEIGKFIIPLNYAKIEYQIQNDTTVVWQAIGISNDTIFYDKKVKGNTYYDFFERMYASNSYNGIQTEVSTYKNTKYSSGTGRGNKYGLEDMDDPRLKALEDKYMLVYDIFSNKKTDEEFSVFMDGWKFGLYSYTQQKVVIPPTYSKLDDVGSFKENVLIKAIEVKNKKQGFINEKNEIILPLIYDDIIHYSDSFYYVTLDKKIGLYNLYTHKTIIEPTYENMYELLQTKHNTFFAVKKDNLYGLIDWNGDVIIPFQYKYLNRLDDTLVRVFLQDWKTGIYNIAKQKEVIPPIYNEIKLLYNYNEKTFLYKVEIEKKFGIIDSKYKLTVPAEFDDVDEIDNYLIYKLKKGNLYGIYISNTIYPYIQPKYESIQPDKQIFVHNGWSFILLKGMKNGKPVWIGENGVEYYSTN